MLRKSVKSKAGKNDETSLVGVARTIGSTLGTVAATAGGAAKDLETFTKSVKKRTLGTTRKLYKRVQKTVGAAPVLKARIKKSRAKKSGAK